MNAADPIIGGKRLPPVDAATSMPPAILAEYLNFFINGIVIAPVATTSEVGLPDIVPNKADEITEILAGAPLVLPVKVFDILKKKLLPPDFSKKVPNKTKRNA
tara:strand:+ start:529 stop:837 length:309 start_codon:yes stop_codon:yes gene_type:complete